MVLIVMCSISVLLRPAGGLSPVLPRGSESGPASWRPGGCGPDPRGAEGSEDEEGPRDKG